MKNGITYLIGLIISVNLLFFVGCTEDTPNTPSNEPITVSVNHFFNGQELILNKIFQGPQGRDMWITKKKYYLSNITAISSSGEKKFIKDIALIDVENPSSLSAIVGEIPAGNYSAISFDLGVREDLNLKDPATYSIEHPLSITNNMYWTWSTQYIFSKLEGHEIYNNDTTSFVIHTGTQSLYRPGIIVARPFTIATGGTEVSINLDIYHILTNPNYTFDLSENGQSHTVDNLDLVVNYMDNFTTAFY